MFLGFKKVGEAIYYDSIIMDSLFYGVKNRSAPIDINGD